LRRVTRKEEVSQLNRRAQQKALEAGKLTADQNIDVKGRTIFKGDRVLFTYTSQAAQVNNGDLGTVERIDRTRRLLNVRLDRGREVTINLRRYDHVEPGWAVTTHKAQGATIEKNVYVLLGGTNIQDLHLSYVQASRAKGDTKFYTTRAVAGEHCERLTKQMSQDREKSFAHDLSEVNRQVPHPPPLQERTL
jgi:ATP-dependent exoDNAse (exonuclease V) alpha subunit